MTPTGSGNVGFPFSGRRTKHHCSGVRPAFSDLHGRRHPRALHHSAANSREYAIARVRLCKIDAEGSELNILRALDSGTLAKIQGFALEYHAEAYALPTLMKTMLQWGSHQVSLMDARPFTGNQIYVISNEVLASIPGTIIPPEPGPNIAESLAAAGERRLRCRSQATRPEPEVQLHLGGGSERARATVIGT